MPSLNLPIISTTQGIISQIENTSQSLVKKVSNIGLLGTAGTGVKGALDSLGNLAGVVPLAGGSVAYVFKKAGQATKIVTTAGDNVIIGTGSIVGGALKGVSDLSILTLGTAKGLIEHIASAVGLNAKLGGRRKKSRKRRRKRKSRKSRKSRKKRRRSRRRRR
tara:strand:+ start:86 stop:574 length:489 start_codon:yes stop_codon:yes gene_type:complete